MKYCIDTSALVDLGERYYPENIPVFAPIWKHIYQEIKSGEIVTADYVRIELEERADEWRKSFIVQADKMFRIDEKIEIEYASVISELEKGHQFLRNKQRDRFMRGADPWIIALARHLKECTVVSGETKKLADYGLGEVCVQLGVRHIRLVEFFQENNIGR